MRTLDDIYELLKEILDELQDVEKEVERIRDKMD
jgi:hypothetical protein